MLSRPSRSRADEPGVEVIGATVAYIHGAPLTPGYLLALLRELSHVPRGLTEIARGEAGTKNEPNWYLVPDQKKGPKIDPHVSNKKTPQISESLISFSMASGPPLSGVGYF